MTARSCADSSSPTSPRLPRSPSSANTPHEYGIREETYSVNFSYVDGHAKTIGVKGFNQCFQLLYTLRNGRVPEADEVWGLNGHYNYIFLDDIPWGPPPHN